MRTAAPIKNNISANYGSALRYGMLICVDQCSIRHIPI